MRRPAPLPLPLLQLASRQDGLLSVAQCERAAVTASRRRVLEHAGMLLRVMRGVVDADPCLGAAARDADPVRRQRRKDARTALLALGDHAVAVGPCALALMDVEGLPRRLRPEAAMPRAQYRRPRGPVVVRCFVDVPVVSWAGTRVADPRWALAQAVCELRRGEAVAVLDSALHRRVLRADQLAEVQQLVAGRRGAATVRPWWDLVDGRAESPLETNARLQCVDAGIPPDDLQLPIRDAAGRLIARGDLAWRLRGGRWLVVEIDGRGPHGTPQALYGDRGRQNAILGVGGIDLLRFTHHDLDRNLMLAPIRHHLAVHR